MISHEEIHQEIVEARCTITNTKALEVMEKLKGISAMSFIYESRDVSPIYGRMSLIGVDPILEVVGKNNSFELKILNERGRNLLHSINEEDLGICDEFELSPGGVRGKFLNKSGDGDEFVRVEKKNIAQILRLLLRKFAVSKKVLFGLYGAFSYDFVRLFEDIGENLPDTEVADFRLAVFDTFVSFDLLKEITEIVVYRRNKTEAAGATREIADAIESAECRDPECYQITDPKFLFSKSEYMKLVETARKYALEGELFEVVFANTLKANFKGDPLALYQKYSEINPAPYLFFFDFGDEQLVGASPEMMVRVENGEVQLRPISGTAKRGSDPIEDHDNMLKLLANEKERAELDMLIDLGRNDLSRICEPGIEIKDYRFVEKYSRVMHTVAHLKGKLMPKYTALDALIACLNAGTLTGAPKVAAMVAIEKHEKERRGFYGGAIGYLAFSGEMDTGIIIRAAHIKNGQLDLKAGATLLYDSIPEDEFMETVNKAQAFLDTF